MIGPRPTHSHIPSSLSDSTRLLEDGGVSIDLHSEAERCCDGV